MSLPFAHQSRCPRTYQKGFNTRAICTTHSLSNVLPRTSRPGGHWRCAVLLLVVPLGVIGHVWNVVLDVHGTRFAFVDLARDITSYNLRNATFTDLGRFRKLGVTLAKGSILVGW